MSQRFFVPSPIVGAQARLPASEARHLAQVMRAQVGDEVLLFDGGGAEFTARISRISRDSVELAVLARRESVRESAVDLTLGVALPKGERQRWLIEKAVELGVTRLVPLQTARGVAQPLDRVLERLRRTVVEASKQCGRNRLLEVADSMTTEQFLSTAPPAALRLLAEPDPSAASLAMLLARRPARTILAAIGPEGGFTPDELRAGASWERVSLGPRILRVETAALALAAAVSLLGADDGAAQ